MRPSKSSGTRRLLRLNRPAERLVNRIDSVPGQYAPQILAARASFGRFGEPSSSAFLGRCPKVISSAIARLGILQSPLVRFIAVFGCATSGSYGQECCGHVVLLIGEDYTRFPLVM